MKCMIPGQNVKILARTLHSLARVGEELFVDALENGLCLCAVNSAQSAFAEFVFLKSFFSSYNVGANAPDTFPKCKISMKSCLSVFKSPHSMDKMVDWCQLRLDPDSVQLIFQVKYTGGSSKTYFLPIIECETLQVKYDKNNNTKLVATSKLLSGVVKNFRSSEDEITLTITKQKTTFKNHIDSTSETNKTVRTELALLAGEFEMYSVSESVSLTFCLKQLRAVVSFAEPAGLPISVYFEAPGRPVVFSTCNEAVYEANFVVSSLASATVPQSQETQKSDLFVASEDPNALVTNPHLKRNKQNRAVSVATNCVSSGSGNIVSEKNDNSFSFVNKISSQSASRKRQRDDCELVISESLDDKNVNNCSSNRTETQDTVLIENCDMDVYDSIPTSPQNPHKLLVNNVFGRCFNSTFQRNSLPGFSNVIAYDSDGLEDSD